MNHFMLPDAGRDGSSGGAGESSRYGVYAMEMLINRLLKLGARRENLEAKVFGGGNVMRALSSSTVGERNAEFVVKFLATEKIPVLAKDLVDIYPRKVFHFAQTGKVRVKKLMTTHNDTIFEREREYVSRIKQTDKGGEIELFG